MLFFYILAGVFVLFLLSGLKIVPQQSAYIVERLGKFHATLQPGFTFIIPFYDRVAYKFNLKEVSLDIPEQICITRDNVQVSVDGVLFMQVVEAEKAAYGISNHVFSVVQLAQTTMRSEVGKIDLDKTFEERTTINAAVVRSIDEAAITWGVKVLRYEIKNITPPVTVLQAMEKQMQAEREKRAVILQSEGQMQSSINIAEGNKRRVVLESEGRMLEQVNNAKGEAEAILSIAHATAESIRLVAQEINGQGGIEAVQLRVAEQLVDQFGKLAKETNTLILPANFGDLGSIISSAMTVVKHNNQHN